MQLFVRHKFLSDFNHINSMLVFADKFVGIGHSFQLVQFQCVANCFYQVGSFFNLLFWLEVRLSNLKALVGLFKQFLPNETISLMI
jgi:hypothetical protein